MRGLRAAEKAFIKLSQIFSNSKDNPTEFQDDILPKLTTAHTVLVKYDQMPRILWKVHIIREVNNFANIEFGMAYETALHVN